MFNRVRFRPEEVRQSRHVLKCFTPQYNVHAWKMSGNLKIIFWQDDNHFLFVISNLIYCMNLVWKGDVNLMLRT